MRILYAIQGTGNGHLSRARDIIPILQRKGDLDLLVSGIQADVALPFEIKYRLKGLSFIFGKKGGVDLWKTYLKSNSKQLLKDIRKVPISSYDLVISDFEPVSSWACYFKRKACISLSHQSAVLNKFSPKPKKSDLLGSIILNNYAPARYHYGFHFKSYDKNIFTPVIRQQIRELKIENKGHYTVYLPSYSDQKLLKFLSNFEDTKWEVFSKHCEEDMLSGNIHIKPVNNEQFIESMRTAQGVLCGAGFETPAETLFLGKKLLAVPMKSQFEQQCNAAALKEMGVPVIKSLKKKHIEKVQQWISNDQHIPVHYPDITEMVIDQIFENFPFEYKEINTKWLDQNILTKQA